MTETISTISLGVRTFNAVILVALALIPVFLHREQYKVKQICTAFDTPSGCAAKGGGLRPIDMISPTTSLYFDDKPSTLYPAVPYYPFYDNTTLPFSSQQAYCTSTYSADADKLATCKLQNVQQLLEMPNRDFYRSLWTFSGGVHIWFFGWLCLWISASFAVIMLPKGYGSKADGTILYATAWLKPWVLMSWHLVGFILTIVFYVDDHWFFMRLPLNNVVIGCLAQLLAMVIQIIWVRSIEEEGRLTNSGKQIVGPQNRGQYMGLSNLMRVAPEFGKVQKTGDASFSVSNWNVFEGKMAAMQLEEAVLIEASITWVSLCLVVLCMGSRVNMDWFIQSFVLQGFSVFFLMAVLYRTLPLIRKYVDANGDWHNFLVFSTCCTAFFPLGLVSAYFLHDFYMQLWNSTGVTNSIFDSSFDVFFWFTYMITIIIIAFYLAYLFTSSLDSKEFSHGVYILMTFLMLCMKFTLAVFIMDPKIWYGKYNGLDVKFNYGYI